MRGDSEDIREVHQLAGIVRHELVGPSCRALLAAGLHGCGVLTASVPYREQRLAPDFAGCLVTLAGRGRVLVDGGWQVLAPGALLALPPQAAHGYAAEGRNWELAWVAGPPAPRPLLRGGAAWIGQGDGGGLAEAIRALRREHDGRGDGVMLTLLASLVRREAELLLQGQAGDALLWRLWREVGGDLRRSWSLSELAARAGLGPEALRRRCQAAQSLSPGALVRRMRLEAAAGLLVQGGRSLAGIADLVGYATPFALSAAFSRHFGCPPERWRRQATSQLLAARRRAMAPAR